MAYNFSTTRYEWVHEKMPRGKGWWMFENRDETILIDIQGLHTLTEAKKLATAKLKEMGVPAGTTIYVCS